MDTQDQKKSRDANVGGAQNISVRPGNFIVPGGENNGGNGDRGGKKNRNRHRGGRGHSRGGENVTAPAAAPVEKPAAPQNPQAGNGGNGGRGKKNRNRHRGERRAEPEIGETLQRELDADFAAPTLSDSLLPRAAQRETAVEDTHEFDVDIATAGYLVEDIPTGLPAPGTPAVEVVGVRFRGAGKVYFFAPGNLRLRVGEHVIVDTARGEELGEVVMQSRRVAERNIIQPLRAVLRRATEADVAHEAENREKEEAALKVCAVKIAAHKLDMRLVDAQYTFDNSKLLFYFTSEGRVDFRDLVRDLASEFRTRIELRQIGIRDEARMIGGLGMCGKPFCCATFLSDFGQVSVKMAKEQGLSINTSKISGCCGRLMCCLRYEQESYLAEAKLAPKKDTVVTTPDGKGVVVEAQPIAGTVKVKLADAPEDAPKTYRREDVTLVSP